MSFNPYRVFKFVATSNQSDLSVSNAAFQSLSGFQVRCNCIQMVYIRYCVMVSIPIGFSSSLQHNCLVWEARPWPCFNPYRVFKFVATISRSYEDQAATLFQSLSGFQVRCNPWNASAKPLWKGGFNPYRVFKFVATLSSWRTPPVASSSFNPYRVFKFVATAPFEWLFLAIILSKSQKLRPPGMNLFRTRPL